MRTETYVPVLREGDVPHPPQGGTGTRYLDLNPNPRMACEDCCWSARGEAGWLACQALVHLSQNPGHRLGYSEPCGITTTIADAQLPVSNWRGKEDTA